MHHKGHNKDKYVELQGKVDHIIKTSGLLENENFTIYETDEYFDVNLVLSESYSRKHKSSTKKHHPEHRPAHQHQSVYNSPTSEIFMIQRAQLIPDDYLWNAKKHQPGMIKKSFTFIFQFRDLIGV